MKTKLFRESLSARIMSLIIIANFIVSIGPVGLYAKTATSDALRTQATEDTEVAEDLGAALTRVTEPESPKEIKVIGILTGGGLAPGHNAAIAAVWEEAERRGIKVVPIWEGWDGLINANLVAQSESRFLTLEDIEPKRNKGGTILRTSRVNPYSKENIAAEVPQKLWENIQRLGLDGLIVLGGDDSQSASYKLQQEHPEFLIIGLPKTIDNDVRLPKGAWTYGARTFIQAATEALEVAKIEANDSKRVVVAPIFGRKVGHVAAWAGANAQIAITLIPEQGNVDLEQLVQDVTAYAKKHNNSAVVLIAEGVSISDSYRNNAKTLEKAYAKDPRAKLAFDAATKAATEGKGTDSYGNPKLEDVEVIIAAVLSAHGLSISRAGKIDYLYRSVDPSEEDRQMCDTLGRAAVKNLVEGNSNRILYLDDKDEVKSIPFAESVGGRTFDLSLPENRALYYRANQALLGGYLASKLKELKKNSGLPIATTPEQVPEYDSATGFWSDALRALNFQTPVYRRVEREKEQEERTTGKPAFASAAVDTDIKELTDYDLSIPEFNKNIRKGEDVRGFILEGQAELPPEAYFMHRGIFASKADIQKAFYDNKIRFDITVIPPAMWGVDFAKTVGHYHSPLEMPEIYQVVSGEVLWMMQKCDEQGNVLDFITVKAKAGDIAIMLPGYGHVSVNLSRTEPLVLADWLTWNQTSFYGSFEKKKGAAYYVVLQSDGEPAMIPNPEYLKTQEVLPTPHQMVGKDVIPAVGLRRGEPIYDLLRSDQFSRRMRFLNYPDDYRGLLTPEATLSEANPQDQLAVLQNYFFADSDPDDGNPQDIVVATQPQLYFTNTAEVASALEGILEVDKEGVVVKVIDEARLRNELVDKLVYDATFNTNLEVVKVCRQLIRSAAARQGAKLGSVYELYTKKADDPRRHTVPAINIRGMAYNMARAIFASAVDNKVGAMIFEIAKSEIGYTQQRPAEVTTAVLAAAIKEGYTQTVYMQGDHFQISAKDYQADADKAIQAIKELIREAVEAGFYQIDLDMSTLVDWTKKSHDEQQKNNYTLTALLTAYVRGLERELGLDKQGIVINLGGEIGEIGMGLDKGQQQNSTVDDLRAFMNGYNSELDRLSQERGYKLAPITKLAIQTGTKHGGVRGAKGELVKVKLSFNTIAELGSIAREEYGLAGVVQHGASTLPSDYFTVFAGNEAPGIDKSLLSKKNAGVLGEHPAAEVHLATAYQDTIYKVLEQLAPQLFEQMRAYILEKFEAGEGVEEDKAFVDGRKNAWGPFKVQVWNLPQNIQMAIRDALKVQFDTVFNNLGVTNSDVAELTWARTAQALNVGLDEFLSFTGADKAIYEATGGEVFTGYVNELFAATPTDGKGRVLIVAPSFFRSGGVRDTLNKVAELSKTVKIALYGEKAEDLKTLLGNKDIMTGRSLEELLTELSTSGILSEQILLLRSPEDILAKEVAIRQIVAREISTVALAKALKELFDSDAAGKAFAGFYEKMMKQGIISEQAYNETREAMLAKLQEGTFELPDVLKLTEQVSAQTEKERLAAAEFIDKI